MSGRLQPPQQLQPWWMRAQARPSVPQSVTTVPPPLRQAQL
jgi:hypothetical protein